MRIRDALAVGAGDVASIDRLVLLAHVLAVSKETIYQEIDRDLSTEEEQRYRELVSLRQKGQPLPYLTGEREFYSRSFWVTPEVLVPQPDTEHLAEAAIALAPQGGRVAEMGIGSGAVLITVALERPDLRLLGTDISEHALAVAYRNLQRWALLDRVTLLQGDLLEPLLSYAPLDLVMMNPPYVRSGDLAGLPPEVQAQPMLALDGGEDGLQVYRKLASGIQSILSPRGKLLLEIGEGQEAEVSLLFRQQGCSEILRKSDLAGITRVLGFSA